METNDLKLTCVIDCRVSDPQQLKGGSLEDQEAICRLTAKRLGIPDEGILHVFKKPHSATTTDRDDIQEIIDFIRDCGQRVNFYIIKSIDRFTREGYPEYLRLKGMLEDVGVQVVDAYGIIQPKKNTLEHLGDFEYRWSKYSPSEASEMWESQKGKGEARDILTRMIGAEIALVREGYAVRRPIDGMKNTKVFVLGKNKTIREPDPERSHFFIKMFEWRAQGIDDKEIVLRINNMGFRTKIQKRYNKKHTEIIGTRGGIALKEKQLQRFIETTEYAGIKCEKWTHNKPIRAQYPGLVSIELWNQANKGKKYLQINDDGSVELLRNYNPNRSKKKLKNNPLFPYKAIRCHLCRELGKEKTFLGSSPAGKSGRGFPTYHCARNHKYFGVPKETFDNAVENFIQNLRFNADFLNGLEITLLNKYRVREKELLTDSSAVYQKIAKLKEEQAAKVKAIVATTSATVRKQLDNEVEELEGRIRNAEKERVRIRITEGDIKTFIKWAKNLMEHPSEWLLNKENQSSMDAMLGLVFEGVPTYQEVVNGTPKLSIVFELSSEFKVNKDHLVTLRGIEPRFKA